MALMTDAEISRALEALSGWEYSAREKALYREFRFPGFNAAIAFVNAVAKVAEQLDHHPDIDVRYDRVKIASSSHDAGGVTKRDIRLVEKIQANEGSAGTLRS